MKDVKRSITIRSRSHLMGLLGLLWMGLTIWEGQHSRLARRTVIIGGGGSGGSGGVGGDPFTRGTHGESGGRKLHVEWLRSFQSPQFL